MKAYWVSGGMALRILDLCTRWRWMSASRSGRFTPWERARCTHWIGGWVGPNEDKNSHPLSGFQPPIIRLYRWAISPFVCHCPVQHIFIFMCRFSRLVTRHEDVCGSGGTVLHILKLGTRWKRVVSFTPRPLNPQYLLDNGLGGPQSRSGLRGEEKLLKPLPLIEPWSSNP
jgi:hypothetical protein